MVEAQEINKILKAESIPVYASERNLQQISSCDHRPLMGWPALGHCPPQAHLRLHELLATGLDFPDFITARPSRL